MVVWYPCVKMQRVQLTNAPKCTIWREHFQKFCGEWHSPAPPQWKNGYPTPVHGLQPLDLILPQHLASLPVSITMMVFADERSCIYCHREGTGILLLLPRWKLMTGEPRCREQIRYTRSRACHECTSAWLRYRPGSSTRPSSWRSTAAV